MTTQANLQSLRTLRTLSRREVTEKLHPARVEEDVSYEKLHGLTALSNPAVHPGWFFFRGDALLMIYISQKEFLGRLSPAELAKELGGEGAGLPSREGKTARMHVHAEKGFAYSEDHGQIGFVEIFPPMSLEQYRATIYEEVTPFYK